MDSQPEIQRTRLCGYHRQLGRLHDDRGVGAIATEQSGKRTDTTILFADHALDEHSPIELDTDIMKGLDGVDSAGEPSLHVHGAPSVHPIGGQTAAPG